MVKKNELEQEDKDVRLVEDILVTYGRFSYGGYSKTYGLFVVVIDCKERKLIKLDVALNSKSELKNIKLDLDNQKFIEQIRLISEQEDHDSQEFTSDLKRSFTEEKIAELLKLAQLEAKAEIESLFKEKVEDLIQEQIGLEVKFTLKERKELRGIYPDIFPEQELNEEEEDTAETEETEEDDKLGLEITLNCSPIISPTRGKKANDLKIGDKLVVKVTDEREVGQYLSGLLQKKQGRAVGSIMEINLKEESERYSIRIKFGPDIYGKLIVDPEVKLTYLTKNDELSEQEENPGQNDVAKMTVDKNLLFLIGGVVVIIIILAVMLVSSL
ncbi:hypothetical protein MWH28_01695 [Natroniella sulfidigena]|uniref:hypothetical protein n=1 Tax=Natroniella sulfidigena TaxID=723921 RepID=UPI00200B10FE|nr:hypothetical protein [Natroniella sulfidigena]MCK8816077.1 hypothetical protein [Natroniella sulfidigena]